jgi:HupE / UreJ protein
VSAWWAAAAIACALALGTPAIGYAHDVPSDVTVVALIKPDGERLRVMLRLPLKVLDPSGVVFSSVLIPKRELGYLALDRLEKPLQDAARIVADLIELYEGDRLLRNPQIAAVRVSRPSDRSFGSYEDAAAHMAAPLMPSDTNISWDEGFFDVMLEYRIDTERSEFSTAYPGLKGLGQRVVIALLFVPASGQVLAYEVPADVRPFRLDPGWYHATLAFLGAGFMHILSGVDHLLFLCCLIIPFRRLGALIPLVTSFTAAHSVTLIASAYDLAPGGAWFPPLIEVLIAASIVYMALENIIAANLRRRIMVTFGFGLIHGFGFSFALRETLQFAGSHLFESLLSFNLGVELGQILVLAVVVPSLGLLFRLGFPDRVGSIILSALVADTGGHWLAERIEPLKQMEWPVLLGPMDVTKTYVLVLLAGSVAWIVAASRWRWSRIGAFGRQ